MSLQLDARQRAMLEEMGVRVFWPEPAAAAPAPRTQPVARAPDLPAAAPPASAPPGAPAQTLPAADDRARRHPTAVDQMPWPALRDAVAACARCALCDGRRQAVFGSGDLQADWLVVGEAPDENEDLQGEPFLGQPGKLLDNMLAALGLDRSRQVYLTNALKCRPPGNRNPQPEEAAACEALLRRQVELLQPRVILAMGRFAVQSLLQTTEPLGRLRGRPHDYRGVPVVVTFHPAYLLRNPADKAKAWADLCLAQSLVRDQT